MASLVESVEGSQEFTETTPSAGAPETTSSVAAAAGLKERVACAHASLTAELAEVAATLTPPSRVTTVAESFVNITLARTATARVSLQVRERCGGPVDRAFRAARPSRSRRRARAVR